MMKTAAILFLFGLFLAGEALAQSADHEESIGQINLMWAQPEGDFADFIDANPVGVNILFGGRVPDLPVFLGTELGYLNYGFQQQLNLHEFEEVPVEVVNSAISHNIFMGHLVARLQAPTGPVQPFIDVLGGVKYFVTRSTIDSDVVVFRRGLRASAHLTDWALSYGVGAGIDLQLYRGAFGIYERPGTASLTLGVRYLFGTEADYVLGGFFDEDMGSFEFETGRSTTDMLIPQAGIRFDF